MVLSRLLWWHRGCGRHEPDHGPVHRDGRAHRGVDLEPAPRERQHTVRGKRDLERATDKLSAEFNHFKDTEFNELKRTVDENHDELSKTVDNKHDELSKTVDNKHETTQRKLDKITDSLADARERLARIEGHLAHGWRPLAADDDPSQDTTNAA